MIRKGDKKVVGDARHIAFLLRTLADIVEKSSQDEVDALLKNKSELRIIDVKTKSITPALKRQDTSFDVVFTMAADKLHSLQTRELGMEFLSNELQTKVLAEKFARFLDLPVLRTDTIKTLHEKIVEAEIGSKLRSEAVQGRQSQYLD